MRVGVLGTGDVGKSLANAFLALNHEVMLGAREASNPAALEWSKNAGPKARVGTFTQAAQFGEIVVLATLGTATPRAIESAGNQHFEDKIVWDVTNPLDFTTGAPRLVGGLGTSAGEIHQNLLPKAKIIKVFNTVGNTLFFRPRLQAGLRGDMFLCGEDVAAKQLTAQLVREFGWEATCMVWIRNAMNNNAWNRAFKLVPTA